MTLSGNSIHVPKGNLKHNLSDFKPNCYFCNLMSWKQAAFDFLNILEILQMPKLGLLGFISFSAYKLFFFTSITQIKELGALEDDQRN